MLNYRVDPGLLQRYVPKGTALDAFCGSTYVSLIGFQFLGTRLFGFAAPFHQAFDEVNLRFYVTRAGKRGVVFISELVPKRAVVLLARLAFHEKYSYARMWHRVDADLNGEPLSAEYGWQLGTEKCSIAIETQGAGAVPADGSLSQFITEHYWGYAAQSRGGSLEYRVEHPRWRVWNAAKAALQGNPAALYGTEMAKVLSGTPESAFLAEGSPVTVYRGIRIS